MYSVRQLQESDFEKIADYFLDADEDFLLGMGVDSSKLPTKNEWIQILAEDFSKPYEQKKFFYIIWQFDHQPVGHSNINKIIFGEEAFMHLHLWENSSRKSGAGVELLTMTLPFYFSIFRLKNLYCEPSASNPAPNKTLQKLGFDFIMQYDTTPGWLNFHQTVNRWCMPLEKFKALQK
ncbi:MAG: GNAT family N-acetyltransferase [Bacteroidetes bacterium]|nr:GNAT family N-acetyltransferase [Bacteroidota bacterium]